MSRTQASGAGGRFVVVEGIEGSGKSTLISGLAERLRARGSDVVLTREPGGTPVGDAVRAIFLDRSMAIAALTEALLVNAARAQHVRDVIRPALAAESFVLCDRFTDSTLAYQGFGRGLNPAMLRELCDAATAGLEPDVTFLIDVPVDVSRQRTHARERDADRLEREDDAFHERVRQGFLELAMRPGYVILDGTLPPEVLVERAFQALVAFERERAT